MGKEALDGEELVGADADLVAGGEGGREDAVGRLDREVDLVWRGEGRVKRRRPTRLAGTN